MPEPATSIPLALATLASGLVFVYAVRHLRRPEDQRGPAWPMHLTLGGIALLCAVVFVARVVLVHHAWIPLQAHVDGLLLIAALLAGAIVYIQSMPRLFGLSLFTLPLLTLILLWGLCASLWTYRPFNLESFEPVWSLFHLGTIYLGLLAFLLGAAGGAMYLFVQDRVKAKMDLDQVNPMASLEALETLIIRSATLGFVLLTLSLVSGFILTEPDSTTVTSGGWWASPKVWLAGAAWLVYAVLMDARASSTFRGRRAAWLAIAGLVLVLATYGVVEAIDTPNAPGKADPQQAEGRQKGGA